MHPLPNKKKTIYLNFNEKRDPFLFSYWMEKRSKLVPHNAFFVPFSPPATTIFRDVVEIDIQLGTFLKQKVLVQDFLNVTLILIFLEVWRNGHHSRVLLSFENTPYSR